VYQTLANLKNVQGASHLGKNKNTMATSMQFFQNRIEHHELSAGLEQFRSYQSLQNIL